MTRGFVKDSMFLLDDSLEGWDREGGGGDMGKPMTNSR